MAKRGRKPKPREDKRSYTITIRVIPRAGALLEKLARAKYPYSKYKKGQVATVAADIVERELLLGAVEEKAKEEKENGKTNKRNRKSPRPETGTT